MDFTKVKELESLHLKGYMRCVTPIMRKTADGGEYFGACGKCPICEKRRHAQWIGRLLLEHAWQTHLYGSASAIFLTLTYNEENLGPTKLEKSDLQKFLKRFRMNTQKNVRYFAAGEYGTQKGRKHWHLILWGPDIRQSISKYVPGWKKTESGRPLRQLSLEEQCTEAWQKGFVHVRPVNPKSIRYVAKYALKQATDHSPMILYSARPGLGVNYIKQAAETIAKQFPELKKFPSTYVVDGRRFSMNSPLHKKAKQFYIDAGGQITRESTTTLRTLASHFQIGWHGEVKRRLGV